MLSLKIEHNNLPLLKQMDPRLKWRLGNTLEEFGEIVQKAAAQAIQSQMPPDGSFWTPLQDWYLAWKERHGHSDQIYIMTGTYLSALQHRTRKTRDAFVLEVGVNKGVMAGSGKIELWKVAQILEYGWEEFDVDIPPRPLWRPLNEKYKRSLQIRVGRAIQLATKEIAAQAKGVVE